MKAAVYVIDCCVYSSASCRWSSAALYLLIEASHSIILLEEPIFTLLLASPASLPPPSFFLCVPIFASSLPFDVSSHLLSNTQYNADYLLGCHVHLLILKNDMCKSVGVVCKVGGRVEVSSLVLPLFFFFFFFFGGGGFIFA